VEAEEVGTGSGVIDRVAHKESNILMSDLNTWEFSVAVTAISLEFRGAFGERSFTHPSYKLYGEGIVSFGEPVEGTSVWFSIMAEEDDAIFNKLQSDGNVGQARISKDVASIRSISLDPSEPFAGINIGIAIPMKQFCELRDNLTLADASRLSLIFRCLGESLAPSKHRFEPQLILKDQDVELNIVSYRINFSLFPLDSDS